MQNTLLDAHNILMQQLERLNDIEATDVTNLTAKQFREIRAKVEVESLRAEAMVKVTEAIVQNANMVMQGSRLEHQMKDVPELFCTKKVAAIPAKGV